MTRGSMAQELTDGERTLLPEVQQVPEGPVLRVGPVVPAIRENCARELAQYPCPGQMGLCGGPCNGCPLRSKEAIIPKSRGLKQDILSLLIRAGCRMAHGVQT